MRRAERRQLRRLIPESVRLRRSGENRRKHCGMRSAAALKTVRLRGVTRLASVISPRSSGKLHRESMYRGRNLSSIAIGTTWKLMFRKGNEYAQGSERGGGGGGAVGRICNRTVGQWYCMVAPSKLNTRSKQLLIRQRSLQAS